MMKFPRNSCDLNDGGRAGVVRFATSITASMALVGAALFPATATYAQADPYGRSEPIIYKPAPPRTPPQTVPLSYPTPQPDGTPSAPQLDYPQVQSPAPQVQPQPVPPAPPVVARPAPAPRPYQAPVAQVAPQSAPQAYQAPAPQPVMTPQQMQQAQLAAINKALGIEQSNVRFGVSLFPSAPPPPDSCIAKVGPVGDTSAFTNAIDGSQFKDPSKLQKLRKKQKTGTIFVRGGNFEGSKIRKLRLSNMCFIDANFRYTNWEDFKGTGLGFINTDMTGARLTNGQMSYTLFRDIILADVDATGVDISHGRLDGGWKGSMRGLVLNKANLTGFRVECGYTPENGCPFDREGLKLAGANLTKASFYAFDFPDADLTGAIMDQTEIGLQHMARMSGAKLVGSMVVRSHNSAAIYMPVEYARLSRALKAGTDGMASFDCGGVASVVKKAICASSGSELRRLDREVARLDQDVLRRNRNFTADRRAWERSVEGKCAGLPGDDIAECLKREYRDRREYLIARAGAPEWLKPDHYALFIASEAPISEDFLKSELFLRVRPVLFDAAPSKVMVHVERNGRITAKGGAMGQCQLLGNDLMFDRNTGWISGGGTPGTRRRPGIPGFPVLQTIGDELKVYRDGTMVSDNGDTRPSPYVRCGSQGSFTLMQMVPLSQPELAQIWEILR